MVKQFTFYGYGFDLGPWGNLKLIGEYASWPCLDWEAKVLGNQPLGVSPEDFLWPRPDALLISGPASFKSAEELALIEVAGKWGIPTAVLCDTHRSFARPPAKGRVGHVVAIVASAREVAAAKDFGYRGAAYLGGPPAWQGWWGLRERNPGRLDERLTLYVGGIKSAEITDELLKTVVAGAKFALGVNWALVFRPHPNEDKPKDPDELARWQAERAEIRGEIFKGVSVVSAASADEALARADISFFTSGATSMIQAAMNRLICGYYESESVRKRMVEQTGEETWWPAEPDIGAVVKVATSGEVADLISRAYSDRAELLANLKRRQGAAYPEPEQLAPWVERRILDFLAGMAVTA